jgi:transcriptional antiterminator RfaH
MGVHSTWSCLFTQPRNERLALESLYEAGIEAYLPCYKAIITHSRKSRTEIRPLFARYIFARTVDDPNKIQTAYRLRGISGFVGKTFHNSIVRDEVIDLIRSRESGDGTVIMDFAGISAGQKLKLIDGPFAGFTALFQEVDDRKRSWILIELIGKMHRLKIDNRKIIPIN